MVFYKMAAAQGDWKAQSNLGVMYAQGLGVKQDDIKAYMWLGLATDQSGGDNFAAENLAVVTKKMTKSQIEEAQNLANKCKQNDYHHCD